MPRATRASTRNSPSQDSPQKENASLNAKGLKRKSSNAAKTPSKRGRPSKASKVAQNEDEKEQKTIEQTMPDAGDQEADNDDQEKGKEGPDDEEMNDAENVEGDETKDSQEQHNGVTTEESNGGLRDEDMNDAADNIEATKSHKQDDEETKEASKADSAGGNSEKTEQNGEEGNTTNGTKSTTVDMQAKKETQDHADTSTSDSTGKITKETETTSSHATTDGSGAVESSQSRGDAQPSNILEKGIIYFFIRARVGMTDGAAGVEDIARSYIVLRPLPSDAKLTDGPIDDLKNNRLLALPKKVLPRTGKDKFMTFVEKAGTSIEELKTEFMEGSSYSTKTTGVSHSPTVTPVGEGVYAITTTGRDSHLAYMLTIPAELGPVQEEIGLAPKGSFVLSLKNPEHKGPANASLDQPAKFSGEIMEEFRTRRWMPVQPKHLDYVNAQLLIIGEGHGELGKAVQADEANEKDDSKETAEEEMEKLEGEDERRVEGLRGDDTVFDDLGISQKEYPKVQTTW